jgi:hypothetical protein
VRRVARELFPDKQRNGQRATYGRDEATAIMARLRKPGFVAPSQEAHRDNLARLAGQNVQVPRSLTGALIHELRMAVKEGLLTRSDPRRLLGLEDASVPRGALPRPAEDRLVSAAQAEAGFRAIRAVAERGPEQGELELGGAS